MIYHGRNGGPFSLYDGCSESGVKWIRKLEEALRLRKVVQESKKAFKIESLSADTFGPWGMSGLHKQVTFTGDATCSVPFSEVLEDFLKVLLIIRDRYK
jgi:hypothetical protein